MFKRNENGDWEQGEYDDGLLSFIDPSTEFSIRCPLESECGRFIVDPVQEYGFTERDVGEERRALVLDLPGGETLRLTDASGLNVPQVIPGDYESVQTVIISRHDAGGEQIAWSALRDVPRVFDQDNDLQPGQL